MIIKGNGSEGKSQIGVVLSSLFGSNMKDGSIGKVSENRFARADLEHILLCVDDDMRIEALRQTNYVKSIVQLKAKWTWNEKASRVTKDICLQGYWHSAKDLYEVYKMWCEENSLIPLKSRSFSDCMVANADKYHLEHCNNITNSAGRRVWGFTGIETVAQAENTANSQRTYIPVEWVE